MGKRYLPPSRPLPKRSHLPATTPTTPTLAPTVVPSLGHDLRRAPIDLDDLERKLFSARPSEGLPILGKWFERARLSGGTKDLDLHVKLFDKLRDFYTSAEKTAPARVQ